MLRSDKRNYLIRLIGAHTLAEIEAAMEKTREELSIHAASFKHPLSITDKPQREIVVCEFCGVSQKLPETVHICRSCGASL